MVLWAHRWCDFHVRVLKSLFERVRHGFNLVYVLEPGNCHENMKRGLARVRTRFACFIDEDIEFLCPYVLWRLRSDLFDSEKLAIVAPAQIYSPHIARFYSYLTDRYGPQVEPEVEETQWVAAYCMMIDLDKVRIEVDTEIPGVKGSTDTDIGLQALEQGYRCGVDKRVAVYHERHRLWSDEKKRRYGDPILDREQARRYYMEQMRYLAKKWDGRIEEPPRKVPPAVLKKLLDWKGIRNE